LKGRLNPLPVVPSEQNARYELALDLSRRQMHKARRLLALPLFEVAVDGQHGMRIAQSKARFLAKEAA
jgi:hypothetical protein